jgi:hypothetical protein
MSAKASPLFWIEGTLAVCSAALFALTLASREWIELIFGVDPDGGSGALEWGIAGTLFATSATIIALARVEWRRARLRMPRTTEHSP